MTTEDSGTLFNSTFNNVNTAGFTSTGTLNAASGNMYASYLLGAVNSANVLDDRGGTNRYAIPEHLNVGAG